MLITTTHLLAGHPGASEVLSQRPYVPTAVAQGVNQASPLDTDASGFTNAAKILGVTAGFKNVEAIVPAHLSTQASAVQRLRQSVGCGTSSDILAGRTAGTLVRARELISRRVTFHEPVITQTGNGRHLIYHPVEVVPEWTSLIIIGSPTLRLLSDPADTDCWPVQNIFRQFVYSLESLEAIKSQSELIPGRRPYFVRPGNAHPYMSLVGAFMTNRSSSRDAVGTPGYEYFVDFTLPEGTGLLRVFGGDFDCYLIPGRPRPAPEVVEAY
ncbi:MAG: hypothetical protein HQM16_11365, partial [Deltaproteobacteria bacterium]|nr:hypothetical protein [Deltaproteobacteria bacterium]